MSTGTPTVRSLDTRIDDLEKEFLTFQARIDMIISLQKWLGGFVLATLVAVVIQTFSISFAAGRLQEKVENQAAAIQEMKTELREIRKELGIIREQLQKPKQ
jgi:hypothetical protein